MGFYPAPGTLMTLPNQPLTSGPWKLPAVFLTKLFSNDSVILCFLLLPCQWRNWMCCLSALTKNFQLSFSPLQLGGRQGWRKCWLWAGWALRGAVTLQTSACRGPSTSGCGKSLLGLLTLVLMLLWALFHNLGYFIFSWTATCMNVGGLFGVFFTWIALDFQRIIFLALSSEQPQSGSICKMKTKN